MSRLVVFGMLAIGVGLAGCTSSTDALRVNTQAPPQPLPSTPSGAFETSELQPAQPQSLDPNQNQQAPTVLDTPNATDTTTEIAALNSEVTSPPITHETMTGAWNVNSDNPDCRVFLSFTKWSGGYRAGTRRCNDPALSSVSAWDVKGNQVVLVDSNGGQVASLGSTGSERYAGSLAGGKPITFSR